MYKLIKTLISFEYYTLKVTFKSNLDQKNIFLFKSIDIDYLLNNI